MSTLEVPTPNRPGHTPSPLASSHLSASTASLAVTDSSGGDDPGDSSSGRGRSQTASSAQTLPSLDQSGRTGSSDTVDSPPGGYGISVTPSSVSDLSIIQEAAGEEDEQGKEDEGSPTAERRRKRDIKPLIPYKYTDDTGAEGSRMTRFSQSSFFPPIFMGGKIPHTRQRSTEIRQKVLFRPAAAPEYPHQGQGQGRQTLVHKESLSSLAQTETTLRPRALSRTSIADSEAIAVLSARAQSARPPRTREPYAGDDVGGNNQSDAGDDDTESEPSIGRFKYYRKIPMLWSAQISTGQSRDGGLR